MIVFSFIIVTYNSVQLIEDCISSIINFADIPQNQFEIIVVDNSNDENHQVLKKLLEEKYSTILLIHNSKNGGYGQGNNIGVTNSRGDYICIMNPDVRLSQPLLQDASRKFRQDENLAMFSYRQSGGANISFFTKPEYKHPFLDKIFTKIKNKYGWFSPVKDYLSGAFFFIRKSDLEAINFFDENIFLYFEEPDISNRLLKKGRKIIWDSSKKYIHLNGSREYNEFAFNVEMKSLLYYIIKFNLNRNQILKNYLREYRFNLLLFTILGNARSITKTQREIGLMKTIFNEIE